MPSLRNTAPSPIGSGQRDLLVVLVVHEGELIAFLEEELIVLLVEPHPLDHVARAEALVELGAGLDVLQLDLPIGAPVAHLHLLRLDRAPELALILQDITLTDLVAVDLHGADYLAGRAGKGGAEANSLVPQSLWLPPEIRQLFASPASAAESWRHPLNRATTAQSAQKGAAWPKARRQDHGVPPLRANRDFRLLWLGSVVSVLGSRASAIAYPLLVLALTGSPADAGLVGFTATIPYLLWQLPAGALVDRWNRKYHHDRLRRRPRAARGEHRPRTRARPASRSRRSWRSRSSRAASMSSTASPSRRRSATSCIPGTCRWHCRRSRRASGAPLCSASPSAASCSISAAPCRSWPTRSPTWRRSPRCC